MGAAYLVQPRKDQQGKRGLWWQHKEHIFARLQPNRLGAWQPLAWQRGPGSWLDAASPRLACLLKAFLSVTIWALYKIVLSGSQTILKTLQRLLYGWLLGTQKFSCQSLKLSGPVGFAAGRTL